MSIREFAKTIAQAASTTLQMSFDPNAIGEDIAKKSDGGGLSPLDVKGYVDSFLNLSGAPAQKQLKFRIRWLPILQLIAAGDVQESSSDRLELFKTAVHRAINASKGDSSPEFRSAWNGFSKSPGDRKLYQTMLTSLQNMGLHNDLIVQLNHTWRILFSKAAMTPKVDAKKLKNPQIVTRHETLDKSSKTPRALPPAKADALNTTLAEYRIEELRKTLDNIINSQISIVSAHPGFDVNRSFGRHLIDALTNSKFRINIQDFTKPDVKKLNEFDLATLDINRVVLVKVQNPIGDEQGSELIDFLRDHFLTNDLRKRGTSRVLFLINTNGATTESAAKALASHIERLFRSDATLPTIGINLKELNDRQAAELLFQKHGLDDKVKDKVDRLIKFARQRIPMLPAILNDLRSIISSLPTDSTEWRQERGRNFAKRGYSVSQSERATPYDEFNIRVTSPSNGGSSIRSTSFAGFIGNEVAPPPELPEDWDEILDSSDELDSILKTFEASSITNAANLTGAMQKKVLGK